MSRSGPTRLLIVGSGISGLAAAWEASLHPGTEVTVVESSARIGGKLLTSPVAQLDMTPIDEGADAFLARVPAALELCGELGLSDELVEPSAARAQVWAGDEPRSLPTDTVLGVPVEFESLRDSGLLSPQGFQAARAELEGNWSAPIEDVSIGEFLAERYGPELVDNVVGPLIGGINAGNVDRLSLRAVTPQLASAAARGGSMTLALRSVRDAAPPPAVTGVFRGLRRGTESLVIALHQQLEAKGVRFLTNSPVEAVRRDGDQVQVVSGSQTLQADAVVVATNAAQAAQLMAEPNRDVAAMLRSISYSSVALVTLVYERTAFGELDPTISGLLVPRSAGLLTTAVSIGSHKWPHWADDDHVVLRASAGHSGDNRGTDMDDDSLLAKMEQEIAMMLGATGDPLSARISRWPNGFAQYEVGHLDLIDGIEASLLETFPNLRLTGASYRGLGIPSCIEQGRSAVRQLLGFE